jgi:hypothetical protein
MPRVRHRKAARERLPAVPASQRERWDRDHTVMRERMARLFGGSRRLDDASLTALMADRQAEDVALATPAEEARR